MIIAEVCNYAPDYAGNFMVSLKSLEKAALEQDESNEMIYVFPSSAREKKWVFDLKNKNKVFFISDGRIKGNLELLKICKDNHVDIIHTHFYGLITGCLVGWFTKTKVVHHFHNTWDKQSLFKHYLSLFLSTSVDKLVGCSKAVFDTLMDAGFPSKKASYITNRIDFNRLDMSNNPNPFSNEKNNILILGTDFYRKGVDCALNAIKPIAEKYNLCLQIVTHTHQETKDLVEKVMGKLPQWVNICNPTETIGDYYRASKIFLSPSEAEGFCYAVHEAIYCNCMVLKTDIPAMTYGLQHEDVITLSKREELGMRIIDFMENENSYKREISFLKEQVVAEYGIEKWGREMFEEYNNLA